MCADCGIRPATTQEAEWLQDYIQKSNNNAAQASINAARLSAEQEAHGRGEERSDDDDADDSEDSVPGSKRNSLTLSGDLKHSSFDDLSDKTPTAATLLAHAQSSQRTASYPSHASIRRHTTQDPNLTLSAPSPSNAASPSAYLSSSQTLSVRQLPHFPSIEDAVANSTSTHGIAAREVWGWFIDHLDAILESVRTFRFDQFEMHIRSFWTNLNGVHREIVHAPAIAGIMAKADAIVYDVGAYLLIACPTLTLPKEILEILRSQMLSVISVVSITSLRQLALKMEKILLVSLEHYGNTFVEPKVELGARFGHLVCAYMQLVSLIFP